ncbi:MAG: acetyl/propionyl/methylcrotonyl-CoA carboxylase subunit alpha [Sphingobium sp.]|nr:acetyl/propionyl/methylcrotonyl-CoA carboxylase subunit alpha [Sphingobium sp.]
MISSLLIANRGEIACRIIRTARRMGIRTVAVYSDADAKALHVRQADEAVHIGASPARESYLDGAKIIAAAKATGAQAIHPGYGFLSENAAFAQAVIDAGLIWVGATPRSIRAMGLKDAAKKLMQEAGVPVTPGYLGEDQSPERLQSEADAIGYPVLIKAVAGGGGKGMRRVDAAGDFADALISCRREAASSFGDDRVLIEKYILSPRHIEVQVFGDTHGNIVHLFERDCSLQRRHQKVIEEAPAPGMDEVTREAICAASVRAAKAVDYVGAGTIEFIADASKGLSAGRIWFMEMNTRLQVEHPVTEEITGIDLVEWQLRVAAGEKLPKRQDELSINGHAIEARLYAEDPARGFLPSTGRLEHLDLGGSGRVETGVARGDQISPFYDPMIAKLVAHGGDRDEAISCLSNIVKAVAVSPVTTNAGFLGRLLDLESFRTAKLDTGLIERMGEALTAKPLPDSVFLAATSWRLETFMEAAWCGDHMIAPAGLFGFRLNAPIAPAHFNLVVDGAQHRATAHPSDRSNDWRWEIAIDDRTDFNVDDIPTTYGPSAEGEPNGPILIFKDGFSYEVSFGAQHDTAAGPAASGAILAPMPGRIIAVEVSAGQAVTKGQKLLTLEAMKMEHSLTAPFDGIVADLTAAQGDQVQLEALLARIEPPPLP